MKRRVQWILLAVVMGGCGSLAISHLMVSQPPRSPKAEAADQQMRIDRKIVDQFEADSTSLKDCAAKPDAARQSCLEQAYGNLAHAQGAQPAFAGLRTQIEAEKLPLATCHRIAHVMGAASLVRYGGNAPRALADGDTMCSSGYYHGVTERALLGVPNDKLVELARGFCTGRSRRLQKHFIAQCMHGLGHGLMLHTRYDLPLSLKVCRAPEQQGLRDGCYSGVFMENVTGFYGVRSPWLRQDNAFFPCTVVFENAKRICYSTVAARIARDNGHDLRATAKTCMTAPARWRSTCARNLGELISEQVRYQPTQIVSQCAGLVPRFQGACLRGAVASVIGFTTDARPAVQMCNRATEAYRPVCFGEVGARLIETVPAGKTLPPRLCEDLTVRYVDACNAGFPYHELRRLADRA